MPLKYVGDFFGSLLSLKQVVHFCENEEIRALLPFFKGVAISNLIFFQPISQNKDSLVPIRKENS